MVRMVKVTVISTMALSTNLAPGKAASRDGERRQRGRSWVGRMASSDFSFDMCSISDLSIFLFLFVYIFHLTHVLLGLGPLK